MFSKKSVGQRVRADRRPTTTGRLRLRGDLVKAIVTSRVKKIDCFEIHPLLRQAIELQRFNLVGTDFLTAAPNPIYDRILVNPPFDNNGVANYTIHAYNFLKPGGELIVLSHHYRLKPSRSDKQFFNWLRSHNARFLNLNRAFMKSDRSTKMPVQLIVINKPQAITYHTHKKR